MSHASLDVDRSLGWGTEDHQWLAGVAMSLIRSWWAQASVGDMWVGGSRLGGVRLCLSLT